MTVAIATIFSFDVLYCVFGPLNQGIRMELDVHEKVDISVIGLVSVDPVVPTPDEIRRACQRIQATWTEEERRRRATGIVDAEILKTLSCVSCEGRP